MLHLPHVLLFPSLVRVRDVNFKGWSDNKTNTVYRLDWSRIDEKRREEHLRWRRNRASSSDDDIINYEFPGFMPKEYDPWVLDMEFVIPHHYLDEIRRTAQEALHERGMERHFDTNIREECLEPAISYAYVSFMLLADCLYDSKENYYYRGPDKRYAKQALLYRFWSFQTGRGCVREHAKFDMLKWAESPSDLLPKEEKVAVLKFIKAIDVYEKELEESFRIADVVEEVNGPSLEAPGDPE